MRLLVCGIAGLLNFDGAPASLTDLQNMTDAIAHRGPDGEGHWTQGPVGLGHRRLAVIDPSPTGHQPMTTHDDRWVITYNGEIYNFRELRRQLANVGCSFAGSSDTEVVLNAIAVWGPAAITHFNGMFAFAIWDRKERRLLLARDRYGIKPLYYSTQGTQLVFASESKGILARRGFRREINKNALLEYMTFQNLFTDQTLISGIKMLPAGHWLQVELDNPQRVRLTRYWDFDFDEPSRQVSEMDYLHELDRLFRQAVDRQLVSDVEVGAYLSGGLDSGLVTSIASESINEMKSFTCGFDLSSASGIELAFDERARAELLSAHFKTEMYEVVLKSGDMERCLLNLAWHLEEPRVGQSYPNLYAAKLASKFVKVVLAGTGGDEIFGGYPWRYFPALEPASFDDFVDQYYHYWQRLVSNTELRSLMSPIWDQVKDVWTRDIFRDVLSGHDKPLERPQDYLNQSLYFEAKTFLHGLLTMEDKLSMAHGLEVRVPLLDNDLVDFASSIPGRLKVHAFGGHTRLDENLPGDKKSRYFSQTGDGKLLLREYARQRLPNGVFDAPKQGFSGPDASWFRGQSLEFVRSRLLTSSSPIFEFFDQSATAGLVAEHLEGRRNRRLLIWSLLNLDAYLLGLEGSGT